MSAKRIAVLVETSLVSGREILLGVSRYSRESENWSIFHQTGALGAIPDTSMADWQGDGVIARIATPEMERSLSRLGVPIVDVLGNVAQRRFPLVKPDDQAISELAGRHFVEHGFRRLAFFGLEEELFSIQRRIGLESFCRRQLQIPLEILEVSHRERWEDGWLKYQNKIRSWIRALPKPVGVMVCSDQFAPELLYACGETGFSVPDQVSFVGVDNDRPFCELCQPQLSSVAPNHERLGYVAAQTLQLIFDGGSPPPATSVPPLNLHIRPSSDATALNDPSLVKALRFIRAKACHEISVEDVAKASGVSRSVLQRRFRSTLRRTVLDSILSIRITRAKELLNSTDLPLQDIAERCGFKHQEYLGYVFKKRAGSTPRRFRDASR